MSDEDYRIYGPEPEVPLTPAQQKNLDEVRLEDEQITPDNLPF